MSFSYESRIRFSETDSKAILTTTALLDYFQDASVFQSEDLKVGVDYLWAHHMGWILVFWQICVDRLPKLGEEVVISTYPYKLKGYIGLRNFEMRTKAGERLAYANSIWTLMDLEKNLPTRIPKDMDVYPIDEPIEMDCCERKLTVPEKLTELEAIPVTHNLIDTNGHVNNGRYVALAQDLLPEGFSVREIRAEYKKQGRLGDVFVPYVCREDGSFTVVLGDENRDPYAIIVFLQ